MKCALLLCSSQAGYAISCLLIFDIVERNYVFSKKLGVSLEERENDVANYRFLGNDDK